MSALRKFLAGWSFRDSTPAYAPGDTIEVMVTGVGGDGGGVKGGASAEGDGGGGATALARIGDSTLRIEGAPRDAENTRVLVRVDSWDDAAHRGVGTYRETVGESAF